MLMVAAITESSLILYALILVSRQMERKTICNAGAGGIMLTEEDA